MAPTASDPWCWPSKCYRMLGVDGSLKLLICVMHVCSDPANLKEHHKEYNVHGNPIGIALVIGNARYKDPRCLPELRAVDVDVRRMSQALEMLGFQVIQMQDISVQQMRQAIKQQLLEEHYNNENCPSCVAFYFSGHGNTGSIYGTDGSELTIKEVETCLNSNPCKTQFVSVLLLFIYSIFTLLFGFVDVFQFLRTIQKCSSLTAVAVHRTLHRCVLATIEWSHQPRPLVHMDTVLRATSAIGILMPA